MKSTNEIHVMALPSFPDVRLGTLVVLDEKLGLSVNVRRIFVVAGNPGTTRGKHAHKELTQILVCVHGRCVVVCDDGKARKSVILDAPGTALEIPPGIWCEQIYETDGTVLMVLCDLPFDEEDYIRDYREFLDFRNGVVT
ncbi:MAG: hypothetical protein CMQ17_11440 [Gammaproteobacteria bacterium]|nr:hypothetical protein [Gammaproteobacteria bacterium]